MYSNKIKCKYMLIFITELHTTKDNNSQNSKVINYYNYKYIIHYYTYNIIPIFC